MLTKKEQIKILTDLAEKHRERAQKNISCFNFYMQKAYNLERIARELKNLP